MSDERGSEPSTSREAAHRVVPDAVPPPVPAAEPRCSSRRPIAGAKLAPSAPRRSPSCPALARAGRATRARRRASARSSAARGRSRARDFLLFAAGVAATAAGAWWLLPDRAKARLAARPVRATGSTRSRRASGSRARQPRGVLNRALTFDDDVAEALYSKDRRVRTYARSEVTPLPEQLPRPHARPGDTCRRGRSRSRVSHRAAPSASRSTTCSARFARHEQVTRLVCVEGWSAVAWWGGIRFADFLARLSAGAGRALGRDALGREPRRRAGGPSPYYVSIDLDTARHPQTLLATHLAGRPLPLAHGAPLRLLAPMKLGLKNIKAITEIEYTRDGAARLLERARLFEVRRPLVQFIPEPAGS